MTKAKREFKPRKKVLSEKNRDVLYSLANKKVQADPKTEVAYQKAQAKVAAMHDEIEAMLVAKIEELYDAADMAALAKYGQTTRMTTVAVQLKKRAEDAAEKGTTGGYSHWRFVGTGPSVPRWQYPDGLSYEAREEWRSNLPKNNVLLKGADETKFLKWETLVEEESLARRAREDSRRSILEDYRSLVRAARTYEDVLEVWPEASEVRAEIAPEIGTALSIFSEDAAERIKADFVRRQKLAEKQAA